jgi:hypothetical protein
MTIDPAIALIHCRLACIAALLHCSLQSPAAGVTVAFRNHNHHTTGGNT